MLNAASLGRDTNPGQDMCTFLHKRFRMCDGVQMFQWCMPIIALGFPAFAHGRKSKRACYVSLGVSLPRAFRDLDKTVQKRRNVQDVHADFRSWYPGSGPWEETQESHTMQVWECR